MALYRSLLLGAATMFVPLSCLAEPPGSSNAMVGTWILAVPETGCRETWEFRADGTTHNQSGSEESTSKYEFAELPDVGGSFVLTDTIVRTNGKPDCSGSLTPVGDRAVLYLLPITTGGYMLCVTMSGSACIGSMFRVGSRDL